MPKKERIQVTIDEKIMREIDGEAESVGCSRSAMIAFAWSQYKLIYEMVKLAPELLKAYKSMEGGE